MLKKATPRLSRIREFDPLPPPAAWYSVGSSPKPPTFIASFNQNNMIEKKTYHIDQLQLYQKIDPMTGKISDS